MIAPHGAALANLLCAREGTIVIEILTPVWRPPDRSTTQVNLAFLHFSWALELRYHGVHVPSATYSGPVDVNVSHIEELVVSYGVRGLIRNLHQGQLQRKRMVSHSTPAGTLWRPRAPRR